MKKHIFTLVLCLGAWLAAGNAPARSVAEDLGASAVVFVYYRIGEDSTPETSIRTEQFAEQVRELASGGYHVMPLADILTTLETGTPLPENAVALTFDGGHGSITQTALPLLQKYGLPCTVFIPTGYADRDTPHYMDWDDIRRLRRMKGVTLGIQPADNVRLSGKPDAEIARQINTARARFREELGEDPAFFAYPFGEYSAAYRAVVQRQGFRAAFGQQSGAANAAADRMALPRFPLTESVGDIDRFRLAAHALPLPVTDVEPADPLLVSPLPAIGFTLDAALEDQADRLSCFISGQEKPALEIMGTRRVEIRPIRPLEADRIRINCTLPVPPGDTADEQRWRWFGMLLSGPALP